MLKLERKQGKTSVTELWFHRRLRVHHGTAVRVGDYVYGSSGDFGPAFITAVDIKTGKEVFRDRGFPKTNLLYAEGKLILLDEDRNLAIAAVVPEGMKVLAKASVLENLAWTAPTLVGTTLYVRDRKTIVALDLGRGR